MGNFRVISKEKREQILHRIKNEGVIAAQAARDGGVSPKTVYTWLAKGIDAEPGILELNKLKRENQFLLELVGRLTAAIEKDKRKGKK